VMLVSGTVATHRHFMRVLEFIIEWFPSPLAVWILALMIRKRLHRRFPWFFLYMLYYTITDLARTVLIGSAAYFDVYWGTEAVAFALAVLALYESFRAIFRTFFRLQWFRLVFPSAIVVIWVYCVWRASTHPPPLPRFGRTGAMLVSGVIGSSFTIVGLVLLFFILAKLVVTRWYLYEFHIVYGLGLASAGMVTAVLVRSEFGKKFIWLTEWGPPLAYLIAIFVWLSAFLRREPQIKIGTPPEVLLEEMQQDLSIVRRIFRRPR
jgi:hypothetical protein